MLLKEHYRCHPKIIGYCNKQFYNDELLPMTQDSQDSDVLKVIQTVKGNHARGHINERQIEVIKQEVLPFLEKIILSVSFPHIETKLQLCKRF